jgi:hypothetical protein
VIVSKSVNELMKMPIKSLLLRSGKIRYAGEFALARPQNSGWVEPWMTPKRLHGQRIELRYIPDRVFSLQGLMPRLRQKCWWTNILVTCTAMAFILIAQHGIASAQSQGPRWGTFVGWKFGTSISYPASGFSALPEPDAHDGRTFVSPDGAQIAVFASYNVLDESIEANLASLTESDGYQRVTYKARGPNWFVLSGLRSIEGREQVFYEKYLFGAGSKTIHAVVVTYPAELKAIYDPLVGRIGNSLHGS